MPLRPLPPLLAGSVVDAVVTFPDAPRGEGFHDRTFTLWIGRDIGKGIDNGRRRSVEARVDKRDRGSS